MHVVIEGPSRSRRVPVVSYATAMMIACCAVDGAVAAKVYRCGNAYQDQPCEAPKPAEVRPADKAAAPATAVPAKAVAQAGATDRVVLTPSSAPASGAARSPGAVR